MSVKGLVGRGLFRLARTSVGGRTVAVVARLTPRLIPGRVHSSTHLLVLAHPQPKEPGHLLAIPRGYVADATEADEPLCEAMANDLDAWVCSDTAATPIGYLMTNVGERQDVGLLHVHLVVNPPAAWERGDAVADAPTLHGALLAAQPDAVELARSAGSIWLHVDDDIRRGDAKWRVVVDPRPDRASDTR